MQKFVNPGEIIAQTGIGPGHVVVDIGCGGGFYTLPAAQAVGPTGTVYAVDILESKLAVTQSLARQMGHKNVVILKADVDKPILEIEEGSVDAVIVASIIHQVYSKESLIKNVYRMLKTGGAVVAVDWKKEVTPFGPALEVRVSPEDLTTLMTKSGFRKTKEIPTDSFHYGLIFTK
jgi:ubiquinone/menaquinone biosynthesis C-methylase UbiE